MARRAWARAAELRRDCLELINLSVDKPAVLRGAYELLKLGGELYFADVYCDRRLPNSVTADPVLYGECLALVLCLLPPIKPAMARARNALAMAMSVTDPVSSERALERQPTASLFYQGIVRAGVNRRRSRQWCCRGTHSRWAGRGPQRSKPHF
jgi:hypothetical protein